MLDFAARLSDDKKIERLKTEIAAVLNRHGIDSMHGIPSSVLSEYLLTCLVATLVVKEKTPAQKGNCFLTLINDK